MNIVFQKSVMMMQLKHEFNKHKCDGTRSDIHDTIPKICAVVTSSWLWRYNAFLIIHIYYGEIKLSLCYKALLCIYTVTHSYNTGHCVRQMYTNITHCIIYETLLLSTYAIHFESFL